MTDKSPKFHVTCSKWLWGQIFKMLKMSFWKSPKKNNKKTTGRLGVLGVPNEVSSECVSVRASGTDLDDVTSSQVSGAGQDAARMWEMAIRHALMPAVSTGVSHGCRGDGHREYTAHPQSLQIPRRRALSSRCRLARRARGRRLPRETLADIFHLD